MSVTPGANTWQVVLYLVLLGSVKAEGAAQIGAAPELCEDWDGQCESGATWPQGEVLGCDPEEDVMCLLHGPSPRCEPGEADCRQQVAKRQPDVITPRSCSCSDAYYSVKDLGPYYFPRMLSFLHCDPLSCWEAPYRCNKRSYTVHVLRNRTQNDPPSTMLPHDLRQHWVFEQKRVVVGCECGL